MGFFASLAKTAAAGAAKGFGSAVGSSMFSSSGSKSGTSSAALASKYVNEPNKGVSEFNADTSKDSKTRKATTSRERGEQLTFGGGIEGEDAWGLALMWNDFLKEDKKDG